MALTRDFLKGLGIEGLNDDLLQKIMDEHGDTVNTNKKTFEDTKKNLESKIATLEARADVSPDDLETLRTSLKDTEEKLKAYDGVNVEDLRTKITAAEGKISEMETAHNAKVSELETDAFLREGLAPISFSSNFARKGIYEALKDKVKYEDGKLVGFEEAMSELREKEPTAFAVDKLITPKDEGKPLGGGEKLTPKKDVPLLI